MRRPFAGPELRALVLIAVIVIPVLVVMAISVRSAAFDTGLRQRMVRDAQTARERVLNLQVDEETGIRGYTSTGDRRFLEPFMIARAALPGAFDVLANAARPVAPMTGTFIDSERQLNREWLNTVAAPLLAAPHGPHALALHIRGKGIVDRVRVNDASFRQALELAATAADADFAAAVSRITMLGTLAAVAVLLLGFGFVIVQLRTQRRLLEQRLLLENERRLTDRLQEAFLQKELPMSPHVGLAATYIPATADSRVGGDWYDAFELPDKRILFSIGDVAGHGIDAAIVMNRARQAIVAAALHEDDPAAVLKVANESILLQEERMVTAIVGYVDPRTLEIVYATAGHPPPILVSPRLGARYLPIDGVPLGILRDVQYTSFVAQAELGSLMVLYTDGVIEHKRDILEGEARLLDAVAGALDMPNPARAVQTAVFGSDAPLDDVAILTIAFQHLGGNEGAAQLDALSASRLQIPSNAPEGEATRFSPLNILASSQGLSVELGSAVARIDLW